MEKLSVQDGTIEYQVRGSGEPLLLVHGAIVADAWEGMLAQGGLLETHQVITYRRRGFGGSSPAPEGRTFGDEGADVVALLDYLKLDRCHIAGHSYGGALVLQLAIDAPDRLATVGLFEPPLFSVPSAAGFAEQAAPAGEAFGAGDHEQAMMIFLESVGGPDPMPRLRPHMAPGAEQMALDDLPTLFTNDLPVASSWVLDEIAAKKIKHPVLSVVGDASASLFQESSTKLESLLPNAERFDLPDASHFLQMENPQGAAEGLGDFLARHATSDGLVEA